MKKLLFLCVGLCITGASFAQEGVKAVTTDGKEVLLKTDGTWAYTQGTTTTDENVCVLEEINEQKSRKDGVGYYGLICASDSVSNSASFRFDLCHLE